LIILSKNSWLRSMISLKTGTGTFSSFSTPQRYQ